MVYSIIIPIYNAAKYIERCLESVFGQNIEHNKFEIIVINDGSTDNGEKIAAEYSKGRNNIRIFTQENKGLGGARNTGIDNAIGEYIIFLDADDYLEENSLSLFSKKITESIFQDVDVFELSCNFVSEQKKVIAKYAPNNTGVIFKGINYYLKERSISSVCNKIYRRSAVENLRFKERIYAEDSEFNSRAYFLFQKVCAFDVVIANFVQTTGSITRSKNKNTQSKYLYDTLNAFKSFQVFERNHSNLTSKEIEYFEKKYTLFTVTIFYLLYKYNMTSSEALKIKAELKENNLYILSYKQLERKRNLFRKSLKYFFPAYILILEMRNRLTS